MRVTISRRKVIKAADQQHRKPLERSEIRQRGVGTNSKKKKRRQTGWCVWEVATKAMRKDGLIRSLSDESTHQPFAYTVTKADCVKPMNQKQTQV